MPDSLRTGTGSCSVESFGRGCLRTPVPWAMRPTRRVADRPPSPAGGGRGRGGGGTAHTAEDRHPELDRSPPPHPVPLPHTVGERGRDTPAMRDSTEQPAPS